MKIKYIEKPKKKIKKHIELENILITIGVTTAVSFLAGSAILLNILSKDANIKNNIASIDYISDDNKIYDLDDIYILYNEEEMLKCYREKKVIDITTEKRYDHIKSNLLLRIPTFSSEEVEEYIYEFHDISNNEVVAATLYDNHSNYKDEDTLNGYQYKRLSQILIDDNLQNKKGENLDYITEEYIEEQIDTVQPKRK